MNNVIFIVLTALVVLAPLPLGSNREWSWTLCALVTGLLALTWTARAVAGRWQNPVRLPAAVIVPYLLVCAWVLVQTSALVPAGWHHPLWGLSAEILDRDLPGSISLAGEDSLVALLRLVTYGLVFFLAFQSCTSHRRAAAMFRWIAFAGLAYSVYGLVMYWGEFGALFWFRDEAFNRDVRGTFVNRNSFATYLGLCVLCGLAGMYRDLTLRRNPAYTVPGERSAGIERFILQAWKPLAGLLLMVSALVLTHSRAGFGSFVLGALVLMIAVNHRRKLRNIRSLAAIGAAFAVTITAFVLTSEVLMQRMDRLTMDGAGRLDAYVLASHAINENPVLGFGYGTFADSFRLYRDDSLTAHFDMAHNTYLENIFELGWPVAALLFLCIGWLAVMCLRGVRYRGRDWIYPATGLAATALVAVHSMFDFSLQIPAVSITYACIMGIACAQSYSSMTAGIAGTGQ